jgi:hypothetical protein
MIVLWVTDTQGPSIGSAVGSFQSQTFMYLLQGEGSKADTWTIKCESNCDHDVDCGGCANGNAARYGFKPGSITNEWPLPGDITVPGQGHLTPSLDWIRVKDGGMWVGLIRDLVGRQPSSPSVDEIIIALAGGGVYSSVVYAWGYNSCPGRRFIRIFA